MVRLNVHYRGVSSLSFYRAIRSSFLGQLGRSLSLSSYSERTHSSLGPHVCYWCLLSSAKVLACCSVCLLQGNLRWVLPQEFVWLVFRASLGMRLRFMQVAWKFVQCFVSVIGSLLSCTAPVYARLERIQLLLNTRLPYFLGEVRNVEDRFFALVRFYAFHWSSVLCRDRVALVISCCVWISVQASALIEGSFAHIEMLGASIVADMCARYRSWFA